MFESNLLSLVINNCSTLSVRKDKQHYRLNFYVSKSKLHDLDLNSLLNEVDKDCKFYYDAKCKRYYLHNKNAVKVLELLEQLKVINYFEVNDFNDKAATVLNNKELFTRSSGKKLTKEELDKLEELRLSV